MVEKVAVTLQGGATVAFIVTALVFVISSVANRTFSWFTAYLAACGLAVGGRRILDCFPLDSWTSFDPVMLMVGMVTKLGAAWEVAQDALRPSGDLLRRGIVAAATLCFLGVSGVFWWRVDAAEYFTEDHGAGPLGWIWEMKAGYDIGLAVAALWVLGVCLLITSVEVSAVNRWFGIWFGIFMLSYSVSSFLPATVVGYYGASAVRMAIQLACLLAWLWPFIGAATGRRPLGIDATAASRRTPGLGRMEAMLTATVLRLSQGRREPQVCDES